MEYKAHFINGSKQGKSIPIAQPEAYLNLSISVKAGQEKRFERYYMFFLYEFDVFYSVHTENIKIIYEGLLLRLQQSKQ